MKDAYEHKRVLVVDDEPESKILLTRYIESLGCEVLTAGDVRTGFLFAAQYQPDLIVLDLDLPDGDGWGLLAQLRREPTTARIPAIVVSASVERDRADVIENAIDALSKPVDFDELLDTVRRNVRPTTGRVLVVDDSEELRVLCRSLLAPHVQEVRVAEHGKAALEILREYRPDLILLDLEMPVMDGFAFLDAVQRDDNLREIPIVVVSARRLTPQEASRLRDRTSGLWTKNNIERDLRRSLQRMLDQPRPE